MSATHTRTERLDCRIAPSQKRLLERAAEKLGLRLTDFVVSTLAMAAQEVVREDEPIRLSRADWDIFVASLEEDRPVSPRLAAAVARFNEGTFEGGRYHG
ncbi:MAG TPA: DUF1778 domain-containing protein [Armatimonadota bacterium]|jgi:uncharacterized protein (DUF1778 family)